MVENKTVQIDMSTWKVHVVQKGMKFKKDTL